ncbi:putative beta-1,3-galactosyltransferase 12 [Chlorella sorokiniana]|uniref:Beta-1,3-galactosyltransferase 12 n=1 Tax=Chlorella sorokiniana TaxID=3076 RepID=A0A2P6TC16_CHLSO|nr:putative beta-1,3-galactosyltransferase 12 [Chlorella sorokiniana]|eukprot:PRW20177.1 putative beta-1,3-galactosyltransferase 12 [Chlorella sorokiniana]
MLPRLGPATAEKADGRTEPKLNALQATADARPAILAFVGVQTGFTTDSRPKYNYEARRAALRASWFPGSRQELARLEREDGIMARFVIGHSADARKEAAVEAEAAQHGDMLRLDLVEGYAGLPAKTIAFLRAVMQRWNPQYIVKADDDVYLRLDRLPHAARQWAAVHADYIGCMKTGPVIKSDKYRWFEPQHALIGSEYFAHAWGTIYVLSGRVAADLGAMRDGALRHFANEDVTIGSWLLAFNASHYDDRRLCEPACSKSSLAVYDIPQCAAPTESTPNLILFSIDDDTLESSWKVMYVDTILSSGVVNPNGCRVSVTWFTASHARNMVTGSCAVVQRAYSKGHELAVHTYTHPKKTNMFTYKQWADEASKQRQWLLDCGIPAQDIQGFRSPGFEASPPLGAVLRDQGYRYDSSLSAANWTQKPYPLEGSTCAFPDKCSGWGSVAGVWEVPAYTLVGKGPTVGRRVDPTTAVGMNLLQRLMADFQRKQGTGVPVPVMVHEPYLRKKPIRHQIVQFLQWASRQPNTWVLNFAQALAYYQAPPGTPVADVLKSFRCDPAPGTLMGR